MLLKSLPYFYLAHALIIQVQQVQMMQQGNLFNEYMYSIFFILHKYLIPLFCIKLREYKIVSTELLP